MNMVPRSFRPVLLALVVGFLSGQPAWAQGMKSGDAKAMDKAVHESVTAVINHGANLFNTYGDYAGCYHAYRAGLIALRPFLAHRPQLQKTIDEGLASAEEKHKVGARAFALRNVLGEIRSKVSTPATPSAGKAAPETPGKKSQPRRETKTKIDFSQPTEKREAEAKPHKTPQVSGKVMYKSRPIPEGWYITLVSSTDKHTYSTYIRDGQYTFRIPIPAGSYTVAIEEGPREKGAPAGAAIPQRYQNPVTSGLTLQVQPGPNRHDLELQ